MANIIHLGYSSDDQEFYYDDQINEINKNIEENCLKKADASATYLSKEDAVTTYLSKDDASGTYLSKEDANSTYLRKDAVIGGSRGVILIKGVEIPNDPDALWIDTANNSLLKYYNGEQWVPISAAWG